MDIVKAIGSSTHTARYEASDDQLAVGRILVWISHDDQGGVVR